MGLGLGEIVIILVIAYVIVGPEEMMKLSRKLPKLLRQVRDLQNDASREIRKEITLVEKPLRETQEMLKETAEKEKLFADKERGKSDALFAGKKEALMSGPDSVRKQIEDEILETEKILNKEN